MNERRAELIYGQVLQRMDMTRETGDEELQELIRMTLEEASEKEYLPLNAGYPSGITGRSENYRNYGEWNGSYFL